MTAIGPRRHGAAVALVAVLALAVVVFVASLPTAWRQLHELCTASGCEPQLSVRGVASLRAGGFGLSSYAAYFIVLYVAFAVLSVAVATAILRQRPSDPMALVAAGAVGLLGTSFPSTIPALVEQHGAWRFPAGVVGTVGQVLFITFFYCFPARPLQPRWTLVPIAVWVVGVLPSEFAPGSAWSFGHMPDALNAALVLGCLGPIPVVQAVRYRRTSGRVLRRQVRAVVAGLGAATTVLVVLSAVTSSTGMQSAQQDRPLLNVVTQTVIYAGMALVPVSVAVTVIRHGLWNLRVVVSRTLLYAGLTAIVGGLYAGVLLLTSRVILVRPSVASVAAAALVAVAFAPLRDLVQRAVNRMVFGWRDDPYRALAALGRRLAETPTADGVLRAIADTVTTALRLPVVSVWLVEDALAHVAAVRGDAAYGTPVTDPAAVMALQARPGGLVVGDLPPGQLREALHAAATTWLVPLLHDGEAIGFVAAGTTSGNEPGAAEMTLLVDLARQAGTAVQAARLTHALQRSLDELRASREELVRAQDDERRRIQRDLHDGLGPALASLRLRLEACLAGAPDADRGELAADLAAAYDVIGQCTADIRRIVHDLRPPALEQVGLVAALQQHCARVGAESGIQVTFTVDDAGPCDEGEPGAQGAADVALLRIAQEAVHNACRHAAPNRIDVRLTRTADEVTLSVSDDGIGLPDVRLPRRALRSGQGLAGMRERAALLGGTLEISANGPGTRVRVSLPARREIARV